MYGGIFIMIFNVVSKDILKDYVIFREVQLNYDIKGQWTIDLVITPPEIEGYKMIGSKGRYTSSTEDVFIDVNWCNVRLKNLSTEDITDRTLCVDCIYIRDL